MTKKILAFGASSSSTSINKQLAAHAASKVDNSDVNLVDLNDYEMPIYSVDKEKASGIHQLAQDFKKHIDDSDGIVISFAEHNGSFSAAFKNVYDWVSRIDAKVWQGKPLLLLATSPGQRGGMTVLATAHQLFSRGQEDRVFQFSLPSFHQNFNTETGVTDATLAENLNAEIQSFANAL